MKLKNTEPCIRCWKDTGVPIHTAPDDHIRKKGKYITNEGQLCEDCAKNNPTR